MFSFTPELYRQILNEKQTTGGRKTDNFGFHSRSLATEVLSERTCRIGNSVGLNHNSSNMSPQYEGDLRSDRPVVMLNS